MAYEATSSAQGEIVISGDFKGTADLPTLVDSGATAGAYKLVKRVSVDKKGRTTQWRALQLQAL